MPGWRALAAFLAAGVAAADDLPAAPDGMIAPAAAEALLSSGTGPVIRLVDAGRASRKPLRYAPTDGRSVQVKDSMDGEVRFIVGGETKQQGKIPTMARELVVRQVRGGAEGSHIQIDVTRVAVGGKVSLAGKAECDVGPTGRVTGMTAMGAGLGPTGFDTSIVVLPDAAVGVGARWQLLRRAAGATNTVQIETYTLRSRSNTEIELQWTTEQWLVGNKVRLPDGSEAAVRRYQNRGGGRATLATDVVVPSRRAPWVG